MKIYMVNVEDIDDKRIDKLCLLINSDKSYKIKKFTDKKDKIRSVIGEILIRTIIEEELCYGESKDIKFEKNKYGKPYIKEYPQFNFNISHSEDIVVGASDNQPIGIDIEKVKTINYEGIARGFFTESEFNYIIKDSLYDKLERFYKIWTLKESYIKCCGQGLSLPLKSFSIDIDDCDNIKMSINNENKEYKFKSFNIELNYKLAVCSSSKDITNNIIRIDQSSLIDKYFK